MIVEHGTIPAVIKSYEFDLSKPKEADAYMRMCRRLPKGRKMEDYVQIGWKPPTTGPIGLETEHIFENQWNSAPRKGEDQGLRVFDWFEACCPDLNIKQGYYIKITPKMRKLRADTYKCGYCGHSQIGGTFCDKCLDSPYLKEKDLHLLRMCPVSKGFKAKRPELTEKEMSHLLPPYVERQTRDKNSRAVAHKRKQRNHIEAECDKTCETAKTKKEGLLWLMDHDVSIDNVIYYSHVDQFCFGWRTEVSEAAASQLLDIISEFPFNYMIKGESGKVWENASIG